MKSDSLLLPPAFKLDSETVCKPVDECEVPYNEIEIEYGLIRQARIAQKGYVVRFHRVRRKRKLSAVIEHRARAPVERSLCIVFFELLYERVIFYEAAESLRMMAQSVMTAIYARHHYGHHLAVAAR